MLHRNSTAVSFSLFALVVLWFIFIMPWAVDGKVIPYDAKNHFYAMIRFVAASYHSGDSLSWSPFHFGGFPMISDPQSVIFTPSLWLPIFISATPSMFLVDITHLAHLLVIGCAIFGFCWSRGWHPIAALLTALTVMFSGAVVIRLEHVLMTVSFMWLSVALWRLDVLIRNGGLISGLLFGAPLALMLIDRDHVAMLGAWFLFVYWLCQVLPDWRQNGFKPVFAQHYPVLVGGVLALLVMVIPLLLLIQLANMSNRPSFTLLAASWQSLQPVSMISFIFPEYFGSLVKSGEYWGPASKAWGVKDLKIHRGMQHLYSGVLPLAVILWFGLAKGRLLVSGGRYFLAFSLIMLLYALGRFTPFFAFLYEYIPGFDLFRRPSDAIFIFSLAISLYAGTLINDALKGAPTRWNKVGITVAILLLSVPILGGFYLAHSFERLTDFFSSLAIFLGFGVLMIAALVLMVKNNKAQFLAFSCLGLLVSADLIFHSTGLRGNARPADYYAQQARGTDEPLFNKLQQLLAKPDPSGVPWRIETIGLGPAVQNIGQVTGFHDLLGYNPIRLAAFEEKIAPNMQNNAPRRRNFGREMVSYDSPLTHQLGLKYIVSSVPLAKLDKKLKAGTFNKIAEIKLIDRSAFIYENPHAEARAIFQDKAGNTSPAKVTHYANDEVRISVTAANAGVLILRDFAYPAWKVTVNGTPAELKTHNGIFRSVALKQGDNDVVFSFKPLSVENLKAAISSLLEEDKP
ncbi:MAG: hypothetical protein ABJK39_15830 [Hyphomicrobiales bacterium]